MQHNFVFQLTFYPFQDKIKRLLSTIFLIQYGYTQDTAVILLLIQTSAIRYRLDTLQTWRPFYPSFRFNYQPQSSDTLQTRMPFLPLHQKFDYPRCSRHGSHSVTYSDPSYSTDTPQTRQSFYYSFKLQ